MVQTDVQFRFCYEGILAGVERYQAAAAAAAAATGALPAGVGGGRHGAGRSLSHSCPAIVRRAPKPPWVVWFGAATLQVQPATLRVSPATLRV